MEKIVQYKNTAFIESTKRINMAYLLLKNPRMIDVMQKTGSHFFHGTNANALPSILKYGINSVNESIENNINVTTGEEMTRINGKRAFISLTDCLEEAQLYANMAPNDNNLSNTLLNFGVIIGTSFEDMTGLDVYSIDSDVSEIGVHNNLPVDRIKFLAVPDDKVEFVKKMVGEKNIEVISMDIKDRFFSISRLEKLNMLEQSKENKGAETPPYPTYLKENIKPVVNQRKTSKIKEIFEAIKAKVRNYSRKDENTNERG